MLLYQISYSRKKIAEVTVFAVRLTARYNKWIVLGRSELWGKKINVLQQIDCPNADFFSVWVQSYYLQ